MQPKFFRNSAAFRKWLEQHHDKKTELIVGYYKVGSGKASMSWPESVDQALCFGWIDGVRRSIDDERYQIRFTPRRPGSIWSAVNLKKIQELTSQGSMHPAGIASFEARQSRKTKLYAHEKESVSFTPAFEKIFKANKKAWKYFQALAPSYQKISRNWVMGAKQEVTQQKRLTQLIAESEVGTNQWKDNKYMKK